MKIKSEPSDDWLWRFSKRHGSACRCTFGVPAEDLSRCGRSWLGWGQGASLLWGFGGIFTISCNNLNISHLYAHDIIFLVHIMLLIKMTF
jgi:hypothetical protein